MNKTLIVFFFLLAVGMSASLCLYAQSRSLHTDGTEADAPTASPADELAEPSHSSLSPEELQAHLLNWRNLADLPLSRYLDGLHQFFELSLPRYEMQPYVLAECLWFRLFVLPQFQDVETDGSLDRMMELNMDLLPDIQQTVDNFFAEIGEGNLPLHPGSDTVVTVFRQLALVSGKNTVSSEYLPELPALTVEHLFIPVDDMYRNTRLYRGLMAFEYLIEGFRSVTTEDSTEKSIPEAAPESSSKDTSEPASPAEAATEDEVSDPATSPLLPPPVGGIDWELVLSDQVLLYVLAHSPSGADVYAYVKDYHSGETPASRCEALYLQCRKLGEQWGFTLESVLPEFSATAVKTVDEDEFLLYCLPEIDLEQLYADLSCVAEIAPAYFARSVELLRRPESEGLAAESSGGTTSDKGGSK